MEYTLWIVIFQILVGASGALAWALKRSPEEVDEREEDLSEWTCPTCGFHVQMGTECIYCGTKKPEREDAEWMETGHMSP